MRGLNKVTADMNTPWPGERGRAFVLFCSETENRQRHLEEFRAAEWTCPGLSAKAGERAMKNNRRPE